MAKEAWEAAGDEEPAAYLEHGRYIALYNVDPNEIVEVRAVF